ncbi:MAG: radical SAM protein [Clostridia bacterium]|nr:radical SAM protein [Clostridia bacterium]MBT7121549.1 radical SAM protein [Clostridia bacterium]
MEYVSAKNIVSGYAENTQWFGANYNMNIYRGCCHGCIYCDSRSECYGVEDFDTVRAKTNALGIIERNLRSKRKKGVVGMGAMSDPYNPFEYEHKLTRGALKLIDRYGFGAALATKSDLVVRDIDVLQAIAKISPVIVKMTVTTSDDKLSRIVEPHVCASSRRFAAIKRLNDAGVYAGVLMMPILPFIEDNERNILGIVRAASASGAQFIFGAFGMTLRTNQRDWYYDKLDVHFPGLKKKYIRTYGDKYSCGVPHHRRLKHVFETECRKLGIRTDMADIIDGYKGKYEVEQMRFDV